MIPWPFVIILLAGVAIHLALGMFSRRFRGSPVQLPFEILMYICAVWAATFALDISTDNLGLKLLFMQIRFLGLPFVTVLLLIITILFSRHGSWLTRQRIALLSVIPLITTVLALLTNYTPLLRSDYHTVITSPGFTVLGFSNGPWSSLIYLPFTYALEIVTVILLLRMLSGTEKISARQALLFLVAIIIPIVSESLFNLGFSPVQGYDMTTSMFAITGILLAIAIFRYRFIDVIPVARSTLFERMADPILVIDPVGRLMDFNVSAGQLLGLDKTRDLGHRVEEVLSAFPDLRNAIGRADPLQTSFTLVAGAGIRTFDISAFSLVPGPDLPSLKMVYLRDVTERTLAEERSHESAEYLNKLIDFANAPIIVWDQDQKVTRFNRAFERLTGRTGKEITGQPLETFIPPANRYASLALIKKTLEGERWENVKIPILSADGTSRTVLWNSANILTAGAELVSTIAQGVDITESECAAGKLAAAEQRYRELFENVSIGILRSTPEPDGKLIETNPAALRIFQADSREQLLALRPADLYADPEERQRISTEILAEGMVSARDVQFRTLKGSLIWGRITSARKITEDGRIFFDNTIEDITERREGEEALRKSEERFRSILNQASDAIILRDRTGRIVAVNQQACTSLGYTRDELLALRIGDFDPGAVRNDTSKRGGASVLQGGTVTFESYHVRKDGSSFPVEVTLSPIVLDDEVLVMAVARDITERKRAGDALRISEERYRSLFENMQEGLAYCRMVFDKDGEPSDFVYLSVNEAFDRIIGAGTVIGKPVTEVFPGIREAFPQLFEIYGRVARTGVPETFDLDFTPSGKWLHLSVYSPGKDHFVAVFSDITDRKHIEEELRESEERFRTIAESVPVLISIGGLEDGKVLYLNAAYNRAFGLAPGEMIGHPAPDLYYLPEDRQKVVDAIGQQGRINDLELQVKGADGTPFWISSSIRQIVYDGKPAIIGASVDITRRKKAEQALAESRARLDTALASMNDGIYITDTGGRLLEFNDAFARFYRFRNREEILKTNAEYSGITEVFMADGSPAPFEQWAVPRALRGETATDAEYIIRRRDSGESWVGSYSFAPIHDSDGEITGAVVTVRDITDRRNAENLLQTAFQRLNTLVSSMHVGILLVWEERIEMANQTFCDYFGLRGSPDELIGLSDTELFEKIGGSYLDRDAEIRRIREIIGLGQPVTGEEIAFRNGNSCLRDFIPLIADGRMRGRLWYHVDITPLKNSEDAFRESEERLRLAQEAANAGTWEWDLTTNANYWSEKTYQLYDLDPGTLSASYDTWLSSVDPRDRSTVANVIREASEKGESINAEWRVNLKEGGERWLLSRGQPQFDRNGRIIGYRGIVIDISERKHAEQQREALIRDLEQKNSELERFSYTVSHDLKSPLITILGFAGLIENDVLNGNQELLKRDISRITEAAAHMQQLLNDVLELSRIGRIVSPPEVTPFRLIVTEALELLAGPLAERKVRVNVSPDLPDVNVDAIRIREVMTNLIENAIKYMGNQPAPLISIGVTRQNGAPIFFVRDNGIGINPRYLQRIFNLFEKLDPSAPGTGVGLTIVKRIIEVHGGMIWAESDGEGKGTTFFFTLPSPPRGLE